MNEPDTIENVASWTVRVLTALVCVSIVIRKFASMVRATARALWKVWRIES